MIHTRPATIADGYVVRELLSQLGHEHSVEAISARLELLSAATDPVLLATQTESVVGLIALHCTTMLHHREPVARITALVVRDGVRRNGIGRILIDAAVTHALQAGCGIMELTTGIHRTDAQAFYKRLGFTTSSLRFHRAVTRDGAS